MIGVLNAIAIRIEESTAFILIISMDFTPSKICRRCPVINQTEAIDCRFVDREIDSCFACPLTSKLRDCVKTPFFHDFTNVSYLF